MIIGLQHWLYFRTWIKNAFAVGTVRANHLLGFPLSTNKDLKRIGWGSSDYRVDCDSGIVIAKWVDNKTVQVASNYVGIEPMRKIKWWDKTLNSQVEVPCTIIQAYNTNMGRVDLVDMLIAFYRIKGGTKRWYIKIFWHLQLMRGIYTALMRSKWQTKAPSPLNFIIFSWPGWCSNSC